MIEDEFAFNQRIALAQMRARGGRWAVYENTDHNHPAQGHRQFITFSKDRMPSPHPPDTMFSPGWRYVLLGEINLETGVISPVE